MPVQSRAPLMVPTCPDCGWQHFEDGEGMPHFCPDCDWALNENGYKEAPERPLTDTAKGFINAHRDAIKAVWARQKETGHLDVQAFDEAVKAMRNIRECSINWRSTFAAPVIEVEAECPDHCCKWCFEHGREVEATTDDGELCGECAQERSEHKFARMYDDSKYGGEG